MTQPTFGVAAERLSVRNVGSLVITPIVADPDGGFVRELRVFGVTDDQNQSPPQVLTVRLASTDQSSLGVTTPALNF